MGLSVNGAKTKALTTLPTISTTTISAVAYKRRMEGVGDTYQAWKQLRTICPICDAAMQMRSIRSHYHSQHPGVRIPTPDNPFLQQNPETDEYVITAYDKHAPIQCPIPSCGVEVKGGWYAIRRDFLFHHHDIKIHVAEEGMLPQCSECGFQCALPHATHQCSRMCIQGRSCKLRRSLTKQIIVARTAAPVLTAMATDLTQVDSFKYLGCWMSLDDTDTVAVAQNIAKAQARWGHLCRLLT